MGVFCSVFRSSCCTAFVPGRFPRSSCPLKWAAASSQRGVGSFYGEQNILGCILLLSSLRIVTPTKVDLKEMMRYFSRPIFIFWYLWMCLKTSWLIHIDISKYFVLCIYFWFTRHKICLFLNELLKAMRHILLFSKDNSKYF